MPIRNKWRDFNEQEINRVPEVAGVYELGDANEHVVYIGSSESSIRARLLTHIKARKTVRVEYFRFKKLDSWDSSDPKEEEGRLVRQYRKQNRGKNPRLQERAPKKSTWPF